ncbi:hypothetical protein [Trinickia mobilis]|uniref:hypothetical protein n=1 Tax=Trinickia mobilis TaxID=2816356 RepID=UPI001A90B59F|nr:hypothetical protein [Trinickia mobilis]
MMIQQTARRGHSGATPEGQSRTETRVHVSEEFLCVIDGELQLEHEQKRLTLRAGDLSPYQSAGRHR